MKKLTYTLLLFAFAFSLFAQEDQFGQCVHCNMLIKNNLFKAEALQNDGSTVAFDAIECLVNYLKTNEESNFQRLSVADYSREGEFIDAQTATYLKSKAIASPMGAYLSAYGDRKVAEKVQKEKGGDLYNWTQLKVQFKNSNFGSLSHPTHHHHKPDAYAPIGVMGDHLHHKGGFMVSARYMSMRMEGNLSGRNEITDPEIFQSYMVAPQAMTMDMVMVGVMYAPSDRLTLMLMQNFVNNRMDLTNRMGMNFSTQGKGIGDLKLSALYGLLDRDKSSIHLNTAISLPVGRVDLRDDTPMMENMKLPYPMQVGTGTVDYTLGFTYKGAADAISWGVQPLATFRTGQNSEGYRFGNRQIVNTWLGVRMTSWVSLSARFQGVNDQPIVGEDPDLNPMMSPPANTANSGAFRVQSFIGMNVSFGDRPIARNFKLGLEYGVPLYQQVDGVQMNQNHQITSGIRYSF